MPEIITAIKSVKQQFQPTPELLQMMETFRQIVNDCIRIGLDNDISTMKKLCNLAYKQLASYEIMSYYKLCAISHAAGILANRKKSIKRNLRPRRPYATKPLLVSCYGFKIIDGILKVPLGDRQYYDILLNDYIRRVLSDPLLKIRSFTLTIDSVSICCSKEVAQVECTDIEGVDRNLRNLTIGNLENIVQYDLSKTIDIADNTRSIIRSFKRNDIRVRRKLYGKYGKRRKNRINQLLHHVSKVVVQSAKYNKSAITFEDIRHIRWLYQRGNYQGHTYRGRMNSWSFAEIKRLITYKAAWEGVPVIQLSKNETRGTSQLCPRCGKKIAQVDRRKTRQLWCDHCKR
ncbi:IS200/IS605 family accessory protein TnpB-related protein [Candidatus Nitrososphaera gargensis]|uniref:IS200/IS605 family accessory protein TnpB-related protein n=1 Tax=Candidatus Nitrososphaera gargensis TaxID=497727 RepID=UPI001650C9EE|nr:IS200/IS605 family accessory protein TnpB-related protein [Candidatus Nitrososphaera gargensis]